jgi:TolB-like protein/tetratricopeptide (TPR) repeat protein
VPNRAVFLFIASLAVSTLKAQCPDGSPPPCRAAASPARASAPPAQTSVAVLPFESRSPDTAQAYIAEGMTDEIADRLTQLGRLQIKPRGVVAAQWRRSPDPIEASRRLNVMWFVHGSVRHAGAQLLVNVQLGRATTSQEVWASRFVRGDADMFAVQAEVAESVAAVIGGRLSVDERATIARRPTRDNEAYRLYLYGNTLLKRRTQADVGAALEAYMTAVRRDSTFAGAWARIGQARAIQFSWGWKGSLSRDSLLALARIAARRALALDSTLADSWAADVFVSQNEGDVARAHAGCDRALRLDSLNADAWHICGSIYGAFGPFGLFEPAVAEPYLRRALALDPSLRNSRRHIAWLRRDEGRLAEAEALFDTVLAGGAWATAFAERAYVRLLRGDVAGARADYAARARELGLVADSSGAPGLDLAVGDSTRMRAALERARAEAAGDPGVLPSLAAASISLGLRDEALAALERYRAVHVDQPMAMCAAATPCSTGLDLWRILHDPVFLPLRDDPRFVRLLTDTRPRIPWRS